MGNFNIFGHKFECGYVGAGCSSEKDAMEDIKNKHLKKVAHTTIDKIVEISGKIYLDKEQGKDENNE